MQRFYIRLSKCGFRFARTNTSTHSRVYNICGIQTLWLLLVSIFQSDRNGICDETLFILIDCFPHTQHRIHNAQKLLWTYVVKETRNDFSENVDERTRKVIFALECLLED